MRRRDLIKSAALVSAGAVAGLGTGLGGLLQFSRGAAAAANKLGAWSSLVNWPLIPIHAVLLGDGRVLTYGTDRSGKQTGYFIYDVWNPSTTVINGQPPNSHYTLENKTTTDIFCSAQIILPQSGDVLIAGGDNWTGSSTTNTGNNHSNIFSPNANTLTPEYGSDGITRKTMNRARWYATPTTLPDGQIYIQGGTSGHDFPEFRGLDGTFSLLEGVNTHLLFPLYPRNWVAPNGKVFGYSDLSMYYVDPTTKSAIGKIVGSISQAGVMPSNGPSGWNSTEVMYAPGQILRCGGGSRDLPEKGGSRTQGKNAAAVIDINGATVNYKKMASMPVSLHWANATVLVDGNVVVTGGSLGDNTLNGANNTALLWRAGTGGWTRGAQSSSGKARLYHSIALLLPDGSVLVGGGGAPGPQTNTNAEIYYPPYLFDSSGKFAPRPTISGPERISYGQEFEVRVSSAVKRVTLIRTGSVTHSFNFEQRFMELSFTTSTPGVLKVQGPLNSALAPPGNYLLFAIDNQDVPSVARIVQIAKIT